MADQSIGDNVHEVKKLWWCYMKDERGLWSVTKDKRNAEFVQLN